MIIGGKQITMGIALKILFSCIPYAILCISKFSDLGMFSIGVLLFSITYIADSFIFCLTDSSKLKRILTFIFLAFQVIFILIPCIGILAGPHEDFDFYIPYISWSNNLIKMFSFTFIISILTTVPTNNYICSKCLKKEGEE